VRNRAFAIRDLAPFEIARLTRPADEEAELAEGKTGA